MTIGDCAEAGPTTASVAIDAAAKINLRIAPPASLQGTNRRPRDIRPHQYREAVTNAIAPLAGSDLRFCCIAK
jgi:hypothetical protein